MRDYIHVTDLASRPYGGARPISARAASAECSTAATAQGYSVLEVIEAVKRASGKSFEVRLSPRRAGDPATLVAGSEKIRSRLGWAPEFADLDRIAAHALAWEEALARRVLEPFEARRP